MSMESPLNEILAIKLFEHDSVQPPNGDVIRAKDLTCWSILDDDDRQFYRDMASGKSPLYDYTKNKASK